MRRLVCTFVVRIWHKTGFSHDVAQLYRKSGCLPSKSRATSAQSTDSVSFSVKAIIVCRQPLYTVTVTSSIDSTLRRNGITPGQDDLGMHCIIWASRQNLCCSLIQAVSQEEPSDRKPDPWPLWMAGHAQLKFVIMECSKTQIRLTRPAKTRISLGIRPVWSELHCPHEDASSP